MKVIKPTKLPVLTRIREVQQRPFLDVSATIAFSLLTPRSVLGELDFWKITAEALAERAVFDEGFSKAQGELLICGSFFSPGGAPMTAGLASVKVGAIEKRVGVIGNRYWRDGVPTAPEPMTTMPLDWAHAFGGPGLDRNPYGMGIAPVRVGDESLVPLPNVEIPDAIVRSQSARPEPMALMPMDVMFAERRAAAGTYDRRWLEQQFPGLPEDADPGFYNVAPRDQRVMGFFSGDEELVVENMHPERARIKGRLPGLGARAFVTRRRAPETLVEVPLRLDTVWLFPDRDLGAVTFHGAIAIEEDDAADLAHLLCACEALGSPRPVEHYASALHRRLDKDRGAIADLSDSDIMPAAESGVAANFDFGEMGRWLRADGRLAKNMHRGQVRAYERSCELIRAQGREPIELGLVPPEPYREPADPTDLDATAAAMYEMVEAVELQKAELEKKQAEADEQARKVVAEQGGDWDKMQAEGARQAAGPPKFSAHNQLEEMARLAGEGREDGAPLDDVEAMLADPAYRAMLEEQEEGLRELYRRFGHMQPTAQRMDDEAADRASVVVTLARDNGVSLARCDFTGADFRQLDLRGLDLRGAFLESADLSGANLSAAILDGAVLAKADLSSANLTGASLIGANLGGARLHRTIFDGANLETAVLSKAELAGARFAGARLEGADWMETVLAGVDLSGATLGTASFVKADARNARFCGATLTRSAFVECDVSGADFSKASMDKVSFIACKGQGAIFRGAVFREGVVVHGSSFDGAELCDAQMTKTCMRGTSFVGAKLDRANLELSDFSECDASAATFDRAVMKKAMMIRAKLHDASLRGANLMDALMSKARLAGADFTGANLYRADLSRIVGDDRTTFAEAELGRVRLVPKAIAAAKEGA